MSEHQDQLVLEIPRRRMRRIPSDQRELGLKKIQEIRGLMENVHNRYPSL